MNKEVTKYKPLGFPTLGSPRGFSISEHGIQHRTRTDLVVNDVV